MAKTKSNSVVATTLTGSVLTITVLGTDPIVFDTSKASDAVRAYATMHGFRQRCADGAALSRNPETGLPATAADKRARVARIVEHYLTGTADWNLTSTGGGIAKFDPDLVLRAIARAKGDGWTAERAESMVGRLATKRNETVDAVLRAMAKEAPVKKAMLEIRAEEASGEQDEEGLFDGLDDETE